MKAAAEISRSKTSLQAATFATNSGLRLLRVGDVKGAIAQFQSAINLAPDYAPGHYHLALALEREGASAQAEAEFQKAAALDPRLKRPTRH